MRAGFDQYDINIVKPVPLVPRELRFTDSRRMDVPRPRSPSPSMSRLCGRLPGACASSASIAVAVAFIHAYANPAHESAGRRKFWPKSALAWR